MLARKVIPLPGRDLPGWPILLLEDDSQSVRTSGAHATALRSSVT